MTPGSDDRGPAVGSTVRAFVIAPLATVPAAAILLVTAYLLGLGSFRGAPPLLVLTSLVTITVFALPIAYLAALVLGIPAYVVARHRGLLGLRHSMAIGAAVALLPLWLYFAFVAAVEGLHVTRGAATALAWTVLFAACGVSSGATFWGIALRSRRPSDRA
jgi:hypothetical protein